MSFSPNYILGSDAGYKFNIANIGKEVYDEQQLVNKKAFKDVIVTMPRDLVDMECLDKNALITVNGYVHPTVWMDKKLYIKGAVEPMLRTGKNHIGILSFYDLNKDLDKRFITEDMLSPEEGFSLYQRVNVRFKQPVDGVIFIFMGYIITEQDNFFKRVSDREFVLYPERINITNKVYEMYRYTDIFESLDIDVSAYNPSVVDLKELQSDEMIIKMLTRFNTFVVNFKGHTVSTERSHLEYTSVPNNYRTELEPTCPMIGSYGKMYEYKKMRFNKSKYTVLVLDNYLDNLIESYTPEDAIALHNNHRRVGSTYRISKSFFLKLILTKQK